MDLLDLAIIVRSLRRSRGRSSSFAALVDLGVASPAELAARAGMSRKHVKGVMIGAMPGFQPALSLVALGLAVPRLTRHGVAFAATEKARVVLAALERREVPRVHLNIASMRSL